MGNCCTDERKDTDARAGNIKAGSSDASAFRLPNYQTKFVPQTFAGIPPAEKDQLLAEVLKLIMAHGNLSRIQPNNPHLKEILKRVHSKIPMNGQVFEGETIDGVGNGKAKIQYKDGSVFEGFVANGHEQGEAKLTNPDGSVYDCTFNRGVVEGLVHSKKGEDTTQSVCVHGKKNGPQVVQNKDRIEFSNWKEDKKNGLEVCIIKNANKIQLTEFQNGVQSGNLKEYFLDNSIKTVKQPMPAAHPHANTVGTQPATSKPNAQVAAGAQVNPQTKA